MDMVQVSWLSGSSWRRRNGATRYLVVMLTLSDTRTVLSHHFVDTRSHNFVDMMSHLFVDIYNVTFWHAHVHA